MWFSNRGYVVTHTRMHARTHTHTHTHTRTHTYMHTLQKKFEVDLGDAFEAIWTFKLVQLHGKLSDTNAYCSFTVFIFCPFSNEANNAKLLSFS